MNLIKPWRPFSAHNCPTNHCWRSIRSIRVITAHLTYVPVTGTGRSLLVVLGSPNHSCFYDDNHLLAPRCCFPRAYYVLHTSWWNVFVAICSLSMRRVKSYGWSARELIFPSPLWFGGYWFSQLLLTNSVLSIRPGFGFFCFHIVCAKQKMPRKITYQL